MSAKPPDPATPPPGTASPVTAEAGPDPRPAPDGGDSGGQKIRGWPARSLALDGLFAIAVFAVLYVARELFIPLCFALMLWFFLRPLVRGMARLGLPRAIASALVLLALLSAGAFSVSRLAGPAVAWFDRMPVAVRVLEQRLRPLRKSARDVSDVAERVAQMTSVEKGRAPRVAVDEPGVLTRFLDALLAMAAGAAVVLFASYFMLTSGDTMMQRLLGAKRETGVVQPTRATLIGHVEQNMSRYMCTITLINTALGVAVGLAMHLLGMPNAGLWGVLAGLVNFVPYLGAVVGIICVGLAALVTFEAPMFALWPPLVYLFLTSLEGGIITPAIIGATFRVNPLAILVWVLFWAWLWGVPGAIVAAPLLMLLKLVCDQRPAWRPVAELLRP